MRMFARPDSDHYEWDRSALVFHWGGAYDINRDGNHWSATRRDGKGELTAGTAETLHDLIAVDYEKNPVQR